MVIDITQYQQPQFPNKMAQTKRTDIKTGSIHHHQAKKLEVKKPRQFRNSRKKYTIILIKTHSIKPTPNYDHKFSQTESEKFLF